MRLKLHHHAQKDSYSCGLRSACTVYGYYSVTTSRLREKLKLIKFRAFPEFMSGTLPWDYLRCLACDGFQFKATHVDRRSLSALRRSMDRGHPGILLTGTSLADLHWTVIGGYNYRGYSIMDSRVEGGWRIQSEESISDSGLLLIRLEGWDGISRALSWRTVYSVIANLPRMGSALLGFAEKRKA